MTLDETPSPCDAILNDTPCIHCGYNLRTLRIDGLCPECGGRVADSTGPELSRLLWRYWILRAAIIALMLVFALAPTVVPWGYIPGPFPGSLNGLLLSAALQLVPLGLWVALYHFRLKRFKGRFSRTTYWVIVAFSLFCSITYLLAYEFARWTANC